MNPTMRCNPCSNKCLESALAFIYTAVPVLSAFRVPVVLTGAYVGQ